MSLSSASGSKKANSYRLNLALQGGGAHGAFTWGVLDRLLEEEDVEIAGISGTSAGAMNAAVLIDGYNEGGRGLAKERLYQFWFEISAAATALMPFSQSPESSIAPLPGFEWLAAFNPLDMMSRVFSPYELNPMNYNPLRNVLENVVKVESLNGGIPLYVTATNVQTGQAKIFHGAEITVDALLASACLPFLYQAVEIDGVPYWDGGYVGNPAIWPLIYKTTCADVMLVQINPLNREGAPKHAIDIINRLNEITFNTSLVSEMRAINFVKRMIHKGHLNSKDYTDVRMHVVSPTEGLACMTASSKTNANWDFLQALHAMGREQMENWLKHNKKSLGKHSTVDIEENFLAKPKSARVAKTKLKAVI